MPGEYSILVVDDEESIRRLLQKELAAPHRRIQTAATAAKALEMCRRESFEVVLLDIRMGSENGLELLPQFLRRLPDAKVIMITGYADVDGAVTAMRNGAYDFVAKPFTLEKLELIIDRAFEHTCLTRENRSYRLSSGVQESLVGISQAVRHTLYLVEKVAPSEVPVLITGESGTGKDVVAAAIHRHSKRASFPYVVKNCAGLQPELARSELFGHAKGAFTNALESREGLMTFAHRGTLFLDEVGELGLEVQAQLLRVLESRRYRRLGEKEERRADVRFLFATNRNLAQEVERGRFHEALFHRINVFQIHLEPLKNRPEDITPLARHFLAKLGGEEYVIAPEAMNRLLRYHWPGNVRELRNVIERGIILAEGSTITERALPRELVEAARPRSAPGTDAFSATGANVASFGAGVAGGAAAKFGGVTAGPGSTGASAEALVWPGDVGGAATKVGVTTTGPGSIGASAGPRVVGQGPAETGGVELSAAGAGVKPCEEVREDTPAWPAAGYGERSGLENGSSHQGTAGGYVDESAASFGRTNQLAEGPHETAGNATDAAMIHDGVFLADQNAPMEHLRLEDMERAHIAHVLNLHGGNKLQAAKALGIARKTLYRKIQELGIG